MKRILYELAAADENLRFSPYCWRIRLALAHKNLPYETRPVRFTDKEIIAFSGQSKVPVLEDDETVVSDSQAIAEYLEIAYPNEASLFGEPPSRALMRFIKFWADDVLHPAIARLVLPDIFEQIAEQDKAYFRETRERAWGMKIEDFAKARQEYLAVFEKTIAPFRHLLKQQNFICGEAPAYADHILFGALQWARLTARAPILDDTLLNWMQSVLDTYGL